MPLLYKYLSPELSDGVPIPIRVLEQRGLLVSDPCSFNDPFEVRPWFDQERHDHFAHSHESFVFGLMGIPYSLTGKSTMVGLPTENAMDFSDELNSRFRKELSARFRVLCLSRSIKSVLMWGHYTKSHSGVAIGVDTDTKGFPLGFRNGPIPVSYTFDRSKTRLPLAFYEEPCVETYDLLTRKPINHPEQLVISSGRLQIPFREYRRQLEEAYITNLTTKCEDWSYEEESRIVYELPQDSGNLTGDGPRKFVQIPPESIKEVLIGFRASLCLVKGIVDLVRSGKLPAAKVFLAWCHPNKYEVSAREADIDYVSKYFESRRNIV